MASESDVVVVTGTAAESAGIGGWLILPAFGLVLAPIMTIIDVILSIQLMPDVQRAGYGGIHAVNILAEMGMLGFLIYAATRFFGKRADAPRTMIALYVAQLAVAAALLCVEVAADAVPYAAESGKALVKNGIGAAIWIPYFRNSRRVKDTFVNP
jgi:hypothetical protein